MDAPGSLTRNTRLCFDLVGPALEAFGDQRIIFGTSPSLESHAKSTVRDWYELVKESLAELGIEQEGVDAIFGHNAQKVYGKKL